MVSNQEGSHGFSKLGLFGFSCWFFEECFSSIGGAREDGKEILIKRIREVGLKEEDYGWYLDLRRYGTVPHVGFGMGLERLLTWMLDLENIIDAIPFPRTTRRFYP
jgi:asparaginyl-tRNA synthetase